MMAADTDSQAADPVVDIGENLLHCLHSGLTLVARFTMQPVHYEEYVQIVRDFDAHNIPYEEFRFRMVALLQQDSNYAHLGVYWDVFDRVILAGEQMLQDNPLFLYPIALIFLLNVFLYYAQNRYRDPLWNNAQQVSHVLASQRELSRVRRRRFRMAAAADPIRTMDPNDIMNNPEWNLFLLLSYFQESWGARFIMGSADYDRYLRLMHAQRYGLMPHDQFMEAMGALLQNPQYQHLRLWWHVHRMDVCGVRRMVDYPLFRRPFAFLVTLNIVLHFAMFGNSLWDLFRNTVRRRRR